MQIEGYQRLLGKMVEAKPIYGVSGIVPFDAMLVHSYNLAGPVFNAGSLKASSLEFEMNLKSVIKKIRKIENDLHEDHHVAAMFIFGSVARGEATSKSDIDILVDFSSDEVGLFEFLDLKVFLESQLGCKVDLVTRDALKSWMKADVEKQAIRVA